MGQTGQPLPEIFQGNMISDVPTAEGAGLTEPRTLHCVGWEMYQFLLVLLGTDIAPWEYPRFLGGTKCHGGQSVSTARSKDGKYSAQPVNLSLCIKHTHVTCLVCLRVGVHVCVCVCLSVHVCVRV